MAYTGRQTKEHAFKTISRDVREGTIPNLLLLCGSEQYLVSWSVDLLVGKYINRAAADFDFSRVEAEKATISGIKENCETLAMLSEKRVVVLQDFSPVFGGELKNFPADDIAELTEYIEKLPQSCILVITADNPDPRRKKNKLYKAIEKNGRIYDFGALGEAQLKGFIEKRLKAENKTAKASVINAMIDASGYYNKEIDYTLYNLENDIKKMIAHSSGEEIAIEDVTAAVSDNLEINVFAMVDAISRNRKDMAYKFLHNLLVSGESVFKILNLISSQLELILEVKELREEGRSAGEIKQLLGVHEFRIKKAMGFADKYSAAELKKILMGVYSVDRNIKTGLLEQSLALEMFIAEI